MRGICVGYALPSTAKAHNQSRSRSFSALSAPPAVLSGVCAMGSFLFGRWPIIASSLRFALHRLEQREFGVLHPCIQIIGLFHERVTSSSMCSLCHTLVYLRLAPFHEAPALLSKTHSPLRNTYKETVLSGNRFDVYWSIRVQSVSLSAIRASPLIVTLHATPNAPSFDSCLVLHSASCLSMPWPLLH